MLLHYRTEVAAVAVVLLAAQVVGAAPLMLSKGAGGARPLRTALASVAAVGAASHKWGEGDCWSPQQRMVEP